MWAGLDDEIITFGPGLLGRETVGCASPKLYVQPCKLYAYPRASGSISVDREIVVP